MEHLLTRELSLEVCSGGVFPSRVSRDAKSHHTSNLLSGGRPLIVLRIQNPLCSAKRPTDTESGFCGTLKSPDGSDLFSTTQCCELPEQFTLSVIEG